MIVDGGAVSGEIDGPDIVSHRLDLIHETLDVFLAIYRAGGVIQMLGRRGDVELRCVDCHATRTQVQNFFTL